MKRKPDYEKDPTRNKSAERIWFFEKEILVLGTQYNNAITNSGVQINQTTLSIYSSTVT